MRHPVSIMLCLGGAVFLSACQDNSDAQVQRALKDVNVIDESNLNDVMLSVADPNEAVEYFTRTLEQNPNRIDVMRGLARSLIRAQKTTESAQVWRQVVAHPEATPEDRVMLADALIRSNQWAEAKAELNQIPPTHESFDRYRLEAMIADSDKNWKKADSFYETAAGLTTTPAGTTPGRPRLPPPPQPHADFENVPHSSPPPGGFLASSNFGLPIALFLQFPIILAACRLVGSLVRPRGQPV